MKIKIITTLIIIITLVPLTGLAQFDFNLENLFTGENDVQSNITLVDFYLIWSADTYVPYEYQGRALPSPGSKITVQAIVTAIGDTTNLKYSWFIENIFQSSKSGYGRTTFSFYASQRPNGYQTIKVQVFNEDRTIFDEISIEIPIVQPEVVIHSYQNHSIFSDQTVKTSNISSGKNFFFTAKPYFFSINKLTDLSFQWKFANQEPLISSAYNANVLNLAIQGKNDEKVIENSLWLNVVNKNNPQQKAMQTIRISIQ